MDLNHLRQAVDIYSISASPSFGILGPPRDSPMIDGHNVNQRKPLLADYKKGHEHEPEDVDRLRAQSALSDKSSFYKQPTQLPANYGCSLLQTIFNGALKLISLSCVQGILTPVTMM